MRSILLGLIAASLVAQEKGSSKQLTIAEKLAIREAQVAMLQARMSYEEAQAKFQMVLNGAEKECGGQLTNELVCAPTGEPPKPNGTGQR